MWKELIQSLTDKCEFQTSVDASRFPLSEARLDCMLPTELKDLLIESNGVRGEYGLGLIWSLEEIEERNKEFRTTSSFLEIYMPFDNLLFFADAGNGDQFAFRILAGVIRWPDIFVWNHEDDSRTWAASSLQQYLERWLNGALKV